MYVRTFENTMHVYLTFLSTMYVRTFENTMHVYLTFFIYNVCTYFRKHYACIFDFFF